MQQEVIEEHTYRSGKNISFKKSGVEMEEIKGDLPRSGGTNKEVQ